MPQIWWRSRADQVLLGHSSIQTAERHLGSEQNIAIAVNHALRMALWGSPIPSNYDCPVADTMMAITERASSIAAQEVAVTPTLAIVMYVMLGGGK